MVVQLLIDNNFIERLGFTHIQGQGKKLTLPVNLHPLFLKIGHPTFWKSGTLLFEKNRVQKAKVIVRAWFLFFLNKEWPCFFQPAFRKKQGTPFFKKQGAGFLRIVGADWLGDCVHYGNLDCCFGVIGRCQKMQKFDFQSQFFTSKIIQIFLIFFHWRILKTLMV